MPRFDVITIGSATQDVYLMSKDFRIVRDRRSPTGTFEEFAFGSKVELEKLLVEVGGGATNAAVTFRQHRLRTACVTRVGADPAGDDVLRSLHQHGIDARFVSRDDTHRTAYSAIFLGKGGERTALVYRGASARFTPQTVPWHNVKARWYYVTSLGGNLRFLRRILAHAQHQGARVAVNPGRAELLQPAAKALLRQAAVLLLNREEAELLFHVRGVSLIRTMQRWQQGIIVVTDGHRGSIAVSQNGTWRVTLTPVRAQDTTGAGDAFGSGFVAWLVRRPQDIAGALQYGSTNAAGEVLEIGAKNGLRAGATPRGFRARVVQVR